jgi:hypothetical protein
LISISLPSNPFASGDGDAIKMQDKIERSDRISHAGRDVRRDGGWCLPLASLLAVGWATCLIALHALHCPFPCSIGPSSIKMQDKIERSDRISHAGRDVRRDGGWCKGKGLKEEK